jgi:transcriptional regulatory protein LevR
MPTQEELNTAIRLLDCLVEAFKISRPPIDIKRVKRKIDPNKHVITEQQFNELLRKYNVSISDSPWLFVNKFPKIECRP